MKRKDDIELGTKIRMLTIIRILDDIIYPCGIKGTQVECQCECGKIKAYAYVAIKYGSTHSCGCLRKKNMTSHGLTKHPLFLVWGSIKSRCYDKSAINFKFYGFRGIEVCDEWKSSFKVFYDWCIANGWRKGLQVDRYPNMDGNYEPKNCRITTSKENNRNRNDNVIITYEGEEKTLPEWADIKKIPFAVIHLRLKRKWGIDRLFNPVREYKFQAPKQK